MDITQVLIRTKPWHRKAACLGLDPDDFTVSLRASQGLPDSKASRRRVKAAKAVCASCPVRRSCFDEGVEIDDRWTIRGGYTPAERRQIVSAFLTNPDTQEKAN